MLLPHPLRSYHAEIQPLKAGGGDGCAGGATGVEEEVADWTGTTETGEEGGGARVVVVIVEVEVVITVETVLVVTTIGVWWGWVMVLVTGQVVKVVKTLYQSDVSLRANTAFNGNGLLTSRLWL